MRDGFSPKKFGEHAWVYASKHGLEVYYRLSGIGSMGVGSFKIPLSVLRSAVKSVSGRRTRTS